MRVHIPRILLVTLSAAVIVVSGGVYLLSTGGMPKITRISHGVTGAPGKCYVFLEVERKGGDYFGKLNLYSDGIYKGGIAMLNPGSRELTSTLKTKTHGAVDSDQIFPKIGLDPLNKDEVLRMSKSTFLSAPVRFDETIKVFSFFSSTGQKIEGYFEIWYMSQ